MDGKSITQIIMDNGDEYNYFCVGGGNDGYYNVFISEDDNEINFTLTKENYDAGLEHQLVTGGQWGDFEDQICVSIDIVIKVAKTYFEKGEKDDSYSWE